MTDTTERLTLAEIFGRHVRIEWHEAVSVARALIERISPDARQQAYAGLNEIFLVFDGTVVPDGESFRGEPTRWVGSVLQAMLTQSEPPVQLRLVMLQASSGAPALGGLPALDEVLAYFERPNRTVVLQNLYARAAVAALNTVAEPPVLAPAPSADAPPKKKRARQVPTARLVPIAAIALLLLVVAGGAWYVIRSRPAVRAAGSAVASTAGDALGSAMLKGASAITESAGLGRLVPADAPPSAPAPPQADAAARDIPLPARRRAPAKPTVPALQYTAFDLEGVPGVAPAPAPAPAPAEQPDAEPMEVVDASIYSANSDGVEPPIGVRPLLARQLPQAIQPEDLTRVEVVVSIDGSVESVRLIDPPRSVIDSMILSAAKAWQFEPAVKDGKPVRYRKTIWIRSR